MVNAKILGANIQKYRREADLTQESTAEKCGITSAYLRQIELGFKVPRLETFLRIAEVLVVSADLLLAGNLSTSYVAKSSMLSDRIASLSPEKKELVLSIINKLIDEIDPL